MFDKIIARVTLEKPIEAPATPKQEKPQPQPTVEGPNHIAWRNNRQEFINAHFNGQNPTGDRLAILNASIGQEPPYES